MPKERPSHALKDVNTSSVLESEAEATDQGVASNAALFQTPDRQTGPAIVISSGEEDTEDSSDDEDEEHLEAQKSAEIKKLEDRIIAIKEEVQTEALPSLAPQTQTVQYLTNPQVQDKATILRISNPSNAPEQKPKPTLASPFAMKPQNRGTNNVRRSSIDSEGYTTGSGEHNGQEGNANPFDLIFANNRRRAREVIQGTGKIAYLRK